MAIEVGASAPDRRVTDTTASLERRAASRDRDGSAALLVDTHAPDRAQTLPLAWLRIDGARGCGVSGGGGRRIGRHVSEGVLGDEELALRSNRMEALELTTNEQRLGLDELDGVLLRKLGGARACQQRMGALFHHEPRDLDRVAHMLHGAHAADTKIIRAEDGVELDLARLCHERADSCIERRVVLEYHHSSLGGVERTTATSQDLERRLARSLDALPMRLARLVGNLPRATMYHHSKLHHRYSDERPFDPSASTHERSWRRSEKESEREREREQSLSREYKPESVQQKSISLTAHEKCCVAAWRFCVGR